MIKMYINVKGSDSQKIKIETYYFKGGQNWFNGRFEERGYYLSAILVGITERDGYIVESYSTPSSGYKMLIMSATRASKKQEDIADKMAIEDMNILIDKICAENDIETE